MATDADLPWPQTVPGGFVSAVPIALPVEPAGQRPLSAGDIQYHQEQAEGEHPETQDGEKSEYAAGHQADAGDGPQAGPQPPSADIMGVPQPADEKLIPFCKKAVPSLLSRLGRGIRPPVGGHASSAPKTGDFVLGRKAAQFLLGENQPAVDGNLKDAAAAGDQLDIGLEPLLQVVAHTERPGFVVSLNAIFYSDFHAGIFL